MLISIALLLAAATAEPDNRPEDVAAWLAASACPDFLTGEFPLAGNDELVGLGFTANPSPSQSARFGELQLVVAEFSNAGILFGGSVDKICTVTVTGPHAPKALPGFKAAKDEMGFAFEPYPDGNKSADGVEIETHVVKIDERTSLFTQVTQSTLNDQPTVHFQLYATVN